MSSCVCITEVKKANDRLESQNSSSCHHKHANLHRRPTKTRSLLVTRLAIVALYLTSFFTSAFTPSRRLTRGMPKREQTHTTVRPPNRVDAARPLVSALPVATAVAPKAAFWQLVTAFCLGGLFFSSVVATIGAVYSFGLQNVLKLLQLIGMVIRRILTDVLAIFGAYFSILIGKRDTETIANRFTRAWRTLKKGLGRAKREISDGVDAVKMESRFIAGAVGPPGLLMAQYVVDRLTPLTFGGSMEKAFTDACTEASKTVKQVRRLTPRSFDPGTVTPKLGGARFFDLGAESIAVDILLKWDSEIVANVDVYTAGLGARIPVSVRNVRFEGPVRVLVTSLQKKEPGFGAMLVSLPERPKIGLDVKVLGGEITKVPWLKSELTKVLEQSINDQLLWPRRMIIPATKPQVRPQTVLSSKELEKLENDDPLLSAERELTDKFGKDVSQYAVAFPGSDTVLDIKVGDDTEEEKEDNDSESSWWDRMKPQWKPKDTTGSSNATAASNETAVSTSA